MVIDVTQKSFNQMISEAADSVAQAINEFEYSCLLDKYNYLQENGVIMEEVEENNSIKTKIKKVINTIIAKVRQVLKWITDKFRSIKNKLTRNKKKEAEDAVKESENEASEAINDLNKVAENPDSESGKKASGIFDRFKKKQEAKAKKFEIIGDYHILKYLDEDGKTVKCGKIAIDIVNGNMSSAQLQRILANSYIKKSFFGSDDKVDELVDMVNSSDDFEEALHKMAYASVGGVFNEKYIRELYALSKSKKKK